MISDTFGRYQVEKEIGDGAMGRVYRGFDPMARRTVAIKTIKSELLSRQSAEEYVRRFRREAQAAGGLSHPNIVTIYDVGESYFVMELLEGETLHDLLKRVGRLPLHDALGILDPVADAVDYAHKKGIIHRDIKPANIMVLPDGRPKLMDFGVVHVDSTAMTAAGQFLGSPLYMAPEQIASGEVTGKTDVFSLATVAYEMLTGRRAFEGVSITSIIYRVMNDTPEPPRRWNLELPPHYDDVFARALAKDPAVRYATATEFASALDLKDFDDTLKSVFAFAAPAGDAPPAEGLETHDLDPGAHTLPPLPDDGASTRAVLEALPPSHVPSPGTGRRAAAAVVRILSAALLVVLGGAWWWTHRSRPAPPPSAAPAVSPAPLPPLLVETDPPGARVFVDDGERGLTPLSLSDLPAGDHVVRVSLEDFTPAQLNVRVTPAGVPPLRFVLEPSVVPLHVDSEPIGTVVVDGKELGSSPVDGYKISAGRHEVLVRAAGYQLWKKMLDAELGQPVSVAARLERVRKVTAPTAAPPEVHEGDRVELTADVVPPKKLSGKLASYPDDAAAKKLQGKVTVELTVDEKGVPVDVVVVESAGPALDEAVLEAVQKWRYEPAVKNGVKVKVRVREWQSFELRTSR
jgi:TonB family protein